MNDLELSVVSTAEGLAALAPEWDTLVHAAARPCPFLLHGWVTAWWRHLGAGSTLAVIAARRGGTLVGIAPMIIQKRHGLRACRLLGGAESALGDLLVTRDDDHAIARALLQRVAQLRFDYLDVFGVPGDGPLTHACVGQRLVDIERVGAPVLNMPDGWAAAYAERIHGKKRALHRRRMRQLGAVGAIGWSTARTPDEVAGELEHAFEIHARRWSGRPDGSSFGVAAARDFHRAAAAALAAQDAVRIVVLRIDDRPVAFQYSFVIGTTLYLHRIAFDPVLAPHSPGQLTLLHAIGDAASEGIRRVEFLGGNERYKLELADCSEPLHQMIGLAQGPLGNVAARALQLVIAARVKLREYPRIHRMYLDGLSPVARMFGRGNASAPLAATRVDEA
jgi:CelD/BcsL family acetyltransferase involved in cellulose biosynthesis